MLTSTIMITCRESVVKNKAALSTVERRKNKNKSAPETVKQQLEKLALEAKVNPVFPFHFEVSSPGMSQLRKRDLAKEITPETAFVPLGRDIMGKATRKDISAIHDPVVDGGLITRYIIHAVMDFLMEQSIGSLTRDVTLNLYRIKVHTTAYSDLVALSEGISAGVGEIVKLMDNHMAICDDFDAAVKALQVRLQGAEVSLATDVAIENTEVKTQVHDYNQEELADNTHVSANENTEAS